MKRVFMVAVRAYRYPGSRHSYEVVADSAERAIAKAKRQCERDYGYKAELVIELQHRGPAI